MITIGFAFSIIIPSSDSLDSFHTYRHNLSAFLRVL